MNEPVASRLLPQKARILIVDDDVTTIRLIGQLLVDFPDQRFATTGEGALALARECKPDVILLDANLPSMTGFDVCELLKNDPELEDVPVIFVTSHDAPALELDALRMGAADYLTKPLVASQLQARVHAQLRKRQRAQGAKATDAASPAHVLALVAGDAAERELLQTLADIGELQFAREGESALTLAASHRFDLILLDVGTHGTDVLKALSRAQRDVPVIVLGQTFDAEIERRAFDLGASDVIFRPFDSVVFRERVKNALAIQRKTEEEAATFFVSAAQTDRS